MTPDIQFLLVACFGALCIELVSWFDQRKNIGESEKKIISSGFYWFITIGMIVVSGIGTYIVFFEADAHIKLKIPFILGAAFPTIFKKIVQISQEKSLPHLGVAPKVSFKEAAKKYFQ